MDEKEKYYQFSHMAFRTSVFRSRQTCYIEGIGQQVDSCHLFLVFLSKGGLYY
jgi:hypothetical protein